MLGPCLLLLHRPADPHGRLQRSRVAVWLSLVVLQLAGGEALAATSRTVSYKAEAVFPAAMRYLRVDRDFPVSESDRDNGYIVFGYLGPGDKRSRGTIEVVERSTDKATATLVTVSVAGAPAFVEGELLDGIVAKLRAERG